MRSLYWHASLRVSGPMVDMAAVRLAPWLTWPMAVVRSLYWHPALLVSSTVVDMAAPRVSSPVVDMAAVRVWSRG